MYSADRRALADAHPWCTIGDKPALSGRCALRPGKTSGTSCPDAPRGPPSGARRAPFQGGLGGLVLLGMMRTRLLPRKTQAVENGAHAGGTVIDAEALLYDQHKVIQRIGRNAVLLRIRAVEHDGAKSLFLLGIE